MVDFVALVARFLSSNKITTKNPENKRKDIENAQILWSAYPTDIRGIISVSLRIVSVCFHMIALASLSDAEAGEDGGEDVGGGEGAGDGGEVVEGGAEVLDDEVAGEVGA